MTPMTNYISCTGNDNCPICQIHADLGSYPVVTKYALNVIDKVSGKRSVMMVSEQEYKKLITFVNNKSFWQRVVTWFNNVCIWFKNIFRR
jgi:hypothetical protein